MAIFRDRQHSGKPETTQANGVRLFMPQKRGTLDSAMVWDFSTAISLCILKCNSVGIVFGLVGENSPLVR